MNHSNFSHSSLDENMYDISISRNINTKKSFKSAYSPQRVGSLTSLTALNDVQPQHPIALSSNKRPGENYFIAKLNQSNPHLDSGIRPKLGESILSLQSDETSHLSHFDAHDSRLSSLSSTSIIDPSPSESPSNNHYSFALSTDLTIDEEEEDEEDVVGSLRKVKAEQLLSGGSDDDDTYSIVLGDMVRSNSTITLRNPVRRSSTGASSNPPVKARPTLTSLSTGNVSTIPSGNGNRMGLLRTKTKYLSKDQIKERQLLRKQEYDANDHDDDEILNNDLDLVFNVPVITNHSELYLHQRLPSSVPNLPLSRKSSVTSEKSAAGSKVKSYSNLMQDNKYYPSPKPFPMPGVNDQASHDAMVNGNTDIDHHVTRNISQYYSQRSTSISKLVKLSREQDLMYKLPNFVKSQSSLDDMQLMSTEKLNYLDQTRPINLPPKSSSDIFKHNKEFKKCLSDFELYNQNFINSRQKQHDSRNGYFKAWEDLSQCSTKEGGNKVFVRKLYKERNSVRSLNWNSNCPTNIRCSLLNGFLQISPVQVTEEDSFSYLMRKYESLPSSKLMGKDLEFSQIIRVILDKPLYKAIISKLNKEKISSIMEEFKTLLYLQSMSSDGLHKHDELFLIPAIIFSLPENSTEEKFNLIQQINAKVLNKEFLLDFNESLGKWGSVGTSPLRKIFGNDNLKEFENLNSNNIWEIINQLSDTQPLSLSAPSTPILIQSFSSLSFDTDNSDHSGSLEGSTAVSSACLELITKIVQSLVVYVNSSAPKKFQLRILQGFMLAIFQFYHFGWNNFNDLTTNNVPIKLNNSNNANENLNSFVNKWKDCLQYF